MRAGLSTLVFFLISTFSFTSARPRPLGSRSDRNDAIARRQFHPARALLDTCANVDLGLFVPPVANVAGDVCLCLSLFPLNLDLFVDLNAIVDILDPLDLEARLKLEVGQHGSRCSYPDNCSPKCSSGNPCDFDCNNGYTKHGNQCVCNAPYTECNGKCGNFPHGCSSSVPRSLREQTPVSPSESDLSALARAQHRCGSKNVCGVTSKSHGYECIDINKNTESCGGCVVPNPFKGSTQFSQGRNCWTIANSTDVSCVSGQCVVKKCADGFEISSEFDSCI